MATYYVFGDECKDNSNAFALYEVSLQRDVGIVMMVIHQMVAFGLFSVSACLSVSLSVPVCMLPVCAWLSK